MNAECAFAVMLSGKGLRKQVEAILLDEDG
jgi:hypothetical protein